MTAPAPRHPEAALTEEERMFAAGDIRDILADVGLDPGAVNRVAWRIVDALANRLAAQQAPGEERDALVKVLAEHWVAMLDGGCRCGWRWSGVAVGENLGPRLIAAFNAHVADAILAAGWRRAPGDRWAGQSIRVEHLVAPGGWLTQRGTHLAACHCRCADVQTCPECGEPSWPTALQGRWDADGGHTARPFDPVWVRLACGCEFGNEALARPIKGADR